jgi:hypothetical protein
MNNKKEKEEEEENIVIIYGIMEFNYKSNYKYIYRPLKIP